MLPSFPLKSNVPDNILENVPTASSAASSTPLIVGGCACAAAYAWLAYQSSGYGAATLTDLLLATGWCALITAALWLGYQRGSVRLPLGLVILFAVTFRLIGLTAYPVLEDDSFRYLWDGFVTITYGSPYDIAPAAFFDQELPPTADAALLDRINYPEVATVYGPVAQWLFALCHWLAPGSVTALQLIAGVADLGTFALLLRLAPVGGAFLYGFSPLLIKEFAMTAHIDAVGIFCMTAALLAFRSHRWLWVGVLLALASGVKIFALILAPFLLGLRVRGWLGFAGTALAVAWPFGLIAAWVPEGLGTMGSQWLFNAPVHLALASADVARGPWLTTTLVLLFGGLWLWCWARWMIRWNRAGSATATSAAPALSHLPVHWLFGVFLILLPVINPWYLAWWLPFAALRPSLTPWVASVAVLLSYASGINLSQGTALQLYQQPVWVLVLEYSIIAVALGWDLHRNRVALRRTRA